VKPGTPQFVGNATSLVLLAPHNRDATALWVSKWQRYVRTEWWLNAWVCSLFRNEGADLSSELINEAVAATLAVWRGPPDRGFVTFVDAIKTRPKRHPGMCFRKAGWEEVGRTKAGLVVLELRPIRFPEPVEPHEYQRPLLAERRDWRNKLSRNAQGAA
jgi:hypothetical protein